MQLRNTTVLCYKENTITHTFAALGTVPVTQKTFILLRIAVSYF